MIFGQAFNYFRTLFGKSLYYQKSVEIAAALLKIGLRELSQYQE